MKLPKNLKLLYPVYGDYQKHTIGLGCIKDNIGILLAMGLGKTYCAINIARWRIQNNNVKKILVIVPTGVLYKWQKEIHKFSDNKYKAIVLHHPNRKKRIELLDRFKYLDYHFGIINYEALVKFFKELYKIPIECIIADESARYLKSLKSKRTQSTLFLGDKVKYRMILTGYLITNRPLDVFSQLRFLDPTIFGWTHPIDTKQQVNYYKWLNHYHYTVGPFKKRVIYKNKIPKLNKKIYQVCIRYDKEEVFKDLPPVTYNRMDIDLDNLDEYIKVKERVIAEIETLGGKAMTNIKHIFTKLIRLRQFTSGFIKDENNKIVRLKNNPKLDVIVEEIETIIECGESVIVWTCFKESLKMLSERLKALKIKHYTMSGADSKKEQNKKWNNFQKSKTINVFCSQVVAGGIGIELFKKDSKDEYQNMIFFENDWVMDTREQAIGRSHGRIGQKAKCRVVDVTCKQTIDEKILDTLIENKEVADMILEKSSVKDWLDG